MNCEQINQIPIQPILSAFGLEPKSKSGAGHWYKAEWRGDKNPSLFVIESRWKDFATGEHGRTIDIVMKLFNCSVQEAIIKITSLSRNQTFFSFQKQSSLSKVEIKKIQSIQNRALLDYLITRNIPGATASAFCQEIYYSVNGKSYFSIGMKNDLGGWEHRNKYFKGCLGKKEITTISGNSSLMLFEGFFDFLSAIVLCPRHKANSVLILNSVSQLSKAIEKIKLVSPEKIECYLDGDDAGHKTFQQIREHFPAEDKSGIYTTMKCKDLNEYLCKMNKDGINNPL